MDVTVAEVVISRFVWHQYDIDATKTRHRGQPRRVLATQLLGYIEGSKPVVVPNSIAFRGQTGVVRDALFDRVEQFPVKNLFAIDASFRHAEKNHKFRDVVALQGQAETRERLCDGICRNVGPSRTLRVL